MQSSSFLFIIFFWVLSGLLNSCSLRSEDVITQWLNLGAKRDYYNFDKDYVLGTKRLRDQNKKSLLAHIAYIEARRKTKGVIAEYDSLFKKNKTPFYEYLKLRAEFGNLNYRQQGKKKEIADKLHQIILENKELRVEGLYDLCSSWGLLKDKKKKRAYVDELLSLKPNYLPYKNLLARTLEPTGEAGEILNLCKEGLKIKDPLFRLCSKITDLNSTNAKNLIKERDALLGKIIEKALLNTNKTNREKSWNRVYRFLVQLSDGENSSKYLEMKDRFTAQVLKKDSNWLPYEYYRRYFDDLTYEEFEVLDKIGKISKKIDFTERIEDFEKLLKVSPSPQVKAAILSNMAYAFMNPANKDHKKAYKYLIQSNEIKALGFYGTTNLLKLIIELKKDPDLGLMIVEDRLKSKLEESIKHGLGDGGDALGPLKQIKEGISLLYAYQGELYLLKKKKAEAKVAFLNSFQYLESEKVAYFLGSLYSETNPLVAIEFLTQSLKHHDTEAPMGSDLVTKRDKLLAKLTSKFLSPNLKKENLLAQYQSSKEEKSEKEVHPFVGKELVKSDLLAFGGGSYDWSRLKGKNVILSFWATWCTPCFQEMAVLKKIQKEGKLGNLHILGVCTDGIEQKRKVKKILKEGGIEFDIALDDGTFKDKYLVSAIPSMFFLDESGKFIKQKTGYSPKLEEEIFKIFK